MAMLNGILSWLFGTGSKTGGQEEPSAPKAKVEVNKEPTPPPRPEPPQLKLAPEHAINRLWSLAQSQGSFYAYPTVRMAGPPELDAVLPPEESQKEMVRLELTVTSTANKRLNAATKTPAKKGGASEEEQEPEALPPMDAQVMIFLTRGQMTAWILVYPPIRGGKEIDREILESALKENQVTFGVNEALLDELPKSPNRYFQLHFLAMGRPAVNGKDGSVVDLFSRSSERAIEVDENNRVDYAALSQVQNVEKGEVICRIIPPTDGEDGMNVQSKELKSRNGKKALPPKGRGTVLSEDGSKLLAEYDGHLEFAGRAFQIKPLLEIGGNVDYSTGNINFVGDVHICGDVCSGFSVRAMGNITVDGVVESCEIEAGGDLVVVKGIHGDNESAVIRANRCVFAKFLENCCVYAKERVQADCVINCQVYSDGEVEVRTGRGSIVGGSVRAARLVSAAILGSRSECQTTVSLGGKPCEDFDYDLIAREVRRMEAELQRTEPQPDSPDKFSRLSKLRMQIKVNRARLEELEEQRSSSTEWTAGAESTESAGRLEFGLAYAGTEIIFDQSILRLTQETHQSTAVLHGQEICLI